MYRDKQVLNTFAKLAADEFLGKNKAALNDTLKKIASQESLTPHQIEYVAGEANRSAWAQLFALDKMAAYNFPLADAKKVIDDLQIKPEGMNMNEADLDYLSPPITTKVANFDPLKAMGFVQENIEKSASAKKEVKYLLQNRMEKLALVKENLEDAITGKLSVIEQTEVKFVKEARTMVLETPFEERGGAVGAIAEFLRGCDRPDYCRTLMGKFSHVLKRQGLVKEADLKAPEEYISDKLPARIINGRHALFVTIKTLFNHYDDLRDLKSRYEIVDSSLPIVKEKIREL